MALTIFTNPASLTAQRNLSVTQGKMAGHIARLSSGLRITKAADDAAGLGISEKLKSEIRSLSMAQRNANDGVSMTQVAEGAFNEVAGILTRMRELAVQAANGTLGSTERSYLNTEFSALRDEVTRIKNVTEFNGRKLLNGSAASVSLQVGIRASSPNQITMSITAVTLSNLFGNNGTAAVDTMTNAQAALAVIDTAIKNVSTRRASLGSVQNRLGVAISNLSVAHENLSAANGRIRDVDVAEETAAFTRSQVLAQAGVAVLAQANQLPSMALSLLG